MAFEQSTHAHPKTRKRIAIIGGGISGLGAAWKLSEHHNVTLFESEAELGGHARTRMAGPNRDIPVDTGFMVFNDATYPHLLELFAELDVPSVPTTMSFAVSLDDGRFEYALSNPKRIFSDPKNILSPKFWGMIRDIFKFNKNAQIAFENPDLTLGELLDQMGVGTYFRQNYLFPLAGAIWSTARQDIENFPATSFVRFFHNHGLLSALKGPQWRTVVGGSKVYVDKLHAALVSKSVTLKLNTEVLQAGRSPTPWVMLENGDQEKFDEIIFACHSNQALEILSDASLKEKSLLSDIKYRPNRVILHGDTSHMPKRKAAWSSWVYRGKSNEIETDGSFTYWMNLLQHISDDTPVFVTLNPKGPIADDLIYDETTLWHPQFNVSALRAQNRMVEIQGPTNIWFCGAYMRYGFHEDGLMSGVEIAKSLNEKYANPVAKV
ncbi:NAD(P)/FAD-dependent oxidoreductase [Hirschia litorea]|uniref:NAD(P)/FAD-dependent oxidoreductase n=1 Tax=Hirschia litorea TaxID=1199156 RepID=A0ABW2IP99_9PROT